MQGQLGVDPQDPVVGGDHRGPGYGDVLRQSRGRNTEDKVKVNQLALSGQS